MLPPPQDRDATVVVRRFHARADSRPVRLLSLMPTFRKSRAHADRPSRTLAKNVALGNDLVIAELSQPASELTIVPVIADAASLHRKTSGYACSSGVNGLMPAASR